MLAKNVYDSKRKNKISQLCQAGGYETIAQGLEHAIDHHLLELRRQRAEKRGKKVRKKLQEKNLTEDKILKDFEIFRENLDSVRIFL